MIDDFAKEYLHGDLRWNREAMVWKLAEGVAAFGAAATVGEGICFGVDMADP